MNFNRHGDLRGKHAFLSASKFSWINYDKERLAEAYSRYNAAQMGTRLHEFAAECISLRQKLPRSRKTLNMYVNDAIGYRMTPEQPLYYSENCFGTADTIGFRNGVLRIHDLKTGTVVPGHMEQLMVYSALFFLEYGVKPAETEIELRIYQNDEILVHNPEVNEIVPIMDKIVSFDKIIRKMRSEADE